MAANFRFGPFQLDTSTAELHCDGEKVRLPEQQFQILEMLLTAQGRLVSRVEIRNRLWPDDTVVEFDRSINAAIKNLRGSLGDCADSPKYIETIARRGYRIIVEVQLPKSPQLAEHIGTQAVSESVLPQPRILFWKRSAIAVLMLGVAIAIWALRRPLRPPHIAKYTQITHDGREKFLIGTDGGQLYIAQARPFAISQVRITTGQITQLPVPLPNLGRFYDVSSDGSTLLVGSGIQDEAGLWIFRIPGGPLGRIAEEQADAAAFSPDGGSVIYSKQNGEIYLIPSDRTGTRKVAALGSGAGGDFSWSPSGDIISFDQDDVFWQMSPDGSNLHRSFPGWRALTGACCGRWTPDMRFFLFLAGDWRTGETQIWALDERRDLVGGQGTMPIQLTAGPTSWDTLLVGKDGKTVFSVGSTHRGELSRFDVHTKQFRPFLGGISVQGLTFSRDGKFVAYVSYPEGILWKANRNGSEPMQLTEPPMNVFMPRWSPDDSQILFSNITSNSEIYVISAQGGNPRKLLPDGSGKQSDPDWSPDGREVVFGTSFGGYDPKSQIRIFDLDKRTITSVPGSIGMTDPRWSPDGRFIAANSSGLNRENIFDVAKQSWTTVPLNYEMAFPEWSRSSQFIYFTGGWPKNIGLYRMRLPGGQVEQVVDLKNWHIGGWFDYWSGLDPTDAPLLLRDVGSSDIYALTLDQ